VAVQAPDELIETIQQQTRDGKELVD